MRAITFRHEDGCGVLRIAGFPFGWAGSVQVGTWWVGIGRWRAIIKAPWNEPLFSERYGLTTTYRLGFGWRAQFRAI
jgi:hypothetical protein